MSGTPTASDISKCEAEPDFGFMVCHRCKSAWEVNDPEKPACMPLEADAELKEMKL